MRGVDAYTGKAIEGIARLRNSIRDILMTPIGSRVMRRDYGSELFSLVDAPMNRLTITRIYNATIEAVIRWEPEVKPIRVRLAASGSGTLTLDLELFYSPTGEVILLDGITV